MWGQTAESQLRHCGLPPNAATLEIATRKCRALCQWRDGVASAASGWVNTHDPRLTFAVPPGAQTADPQKYPEKPDRAKTIRLVSLVWMGDSPDLIQPT